MRKINVKELTNLLKMTQPQVKTYVTSTLKTLGYKVVVGDGFVIGLGDTPIGLIAHMDTVHAVPRVVHNVSGVLSSPTGLGADDRAGVYGILHLLRDGFKPTVIFCEDEEIGTVGAMKFVRSGIQLDLNFLIELDRQGSTDCVFYDCENVDFIAYVEKFGFKEAIGSFTDISELCPHLGIAGVNLSIGYYGQHTKTERLVLSELNTTLRKIGRILSDAKSKRFEYVERARLSYAKYGKWTDDDDYSWYKDEPVVKIMNKVSADKKWNMSQDFPLVRITKGIVYYIDDNDVEIYEQVESSDHVYFIGQDDKIYIDTELETPLYGHAYDDVWSPMTYYDFI